MSDNTIKTLEITSVNDIQLDTINMIIIALKSVSSELRPQILRYCLKRAEREQYPSSVGLIAQSQLGKKS